MNAFRLENLEELLTNENQLNSLPDTIGCLQKLHTLIADCNCLSHLPPSIVRCKQLRVLSLSENRLQQLPTDVGDLLNLQVLNVSGNCLAHLPGSLLNIRKLRALWLSENQCKPMVALHTEWVQQRAILTCVLLPQRKCNLDPMQATGNNGNESFPGKHQRKQSKNEIFLHNFRQNLDGQMLSQRRSSGSGELRINFEDSIKLNRTKHAGNSSRDETV